MDEIEFVPFGKIPRWNRQVIISEKIDGTNGTVHIQGDEIRVASRSHWIDVEHDHFGFARYVEANREMFLQLGDGVHRGEWWGQGIGRKYGLDHKRFSLFNSGKWTAETLPEGLFVVPILAIMPWPDTRAINEVLDMLRTEGSKAAPGFMRPEGIIIFHVQGNLYFKATIEKDEKPKGSKELG